LNGFGVYAGKRHPLRKTRHASSTLAIAKAVGIGRASIYRVLEG
jgi:hypothetical protein